MSSYETIRYEVSGGIARLTLDRPDQRNGMTNEKKCTGDDSAQ